MARRQTRAREKVNGERVVYSKSRTKEPGAARFSEHHAANFAVFISVLPKSLIGRKHQISDSAWE
jgi:hypothetical protein